MIVNEVMELWDKYGVIVIFEVLIMYWVWLIIMIGCEFCVYKEVKFEIFV